MLRRQALVLFICGPLGATSAGAATLSRSELNAAANDASRLRDAIAEFTKKSIGPEVTAGQPTYQSRVGDAELLFLLGDYGRAALLFYDLVSATDAAGRPQYAQCLYSLAESLYQTGNDRPARRYFEELINRRDEAHLTEAVRRLIQIADRQERWDGLDLFIAATAGQGGLPPDIAYLRAKSLLRQGHPQEVEAALAPLHKGHHLYAKAQYLLAVASIELGQIDRARSLFYAVAQRDERSDDDTQVRDLANMDEGRLLLEDGKLLEARAAYHNVSHASEAFDEALFEVTWTHVRAAAEMTDEAERNQEYRKAIDNLEIVLLNEGHALLVPEARLLLGNIYLKLGQYKDATDTFNDVVQTYRPVRDKVISLSKSGVDTTHLFRLKGFKPGLTPLPTVASRLADDDRRLRQGLSVVQNLDDCDTTLKDAQHIAEKLMLALGPKHHVGLFPYLRDVQKQEAELERGLLALTQRMVAMQTSLIEQFLPKDKLDKLHDLQAQRGALEAELDAKPDETDVYDALIAGLKQNLDDLEKSALYARWELEAQARQLGALRTWAAENPQAIKAADALKFAELMSFAEDVVDDLQREDDLLSDAVRRDKFTVVMTGSDVDDERERRAQYNSMLQEELALLAVGKDAVSPDDRGALDQLSDTLSVLANEHAELLAFDKRLSDTVGERALSARSMVLKEQGVLELAHKDFEAARAQVHEVVGALARTSLHTVGNTFKDIVLRGDVGLVDAAWLIKDQQSRAISDKVNEQHDVLQNLDADFKEVVPRPD